jgi:hypothetical protein
VKASCPS